MPGTPPAVANWLKARYPRPQIDSEWLDLCYEWVLESNNLNPATDTVAIQAAVQEQYLSSNLSDSTVRGTGFPERLKELVNHVVEGPILVEITAMDDIGVSAYTLNKNRLVRKERMEAGEVEQGEGDEDVEGEGPIPKYPRSTLSLQITDGTHILKALEDKPLPELELGVTPLGCKLLLKKVTFMRGTALLSKDCVSVEGYQTEEREANRERDFARGLRIRLGLPEPDPEEDEPGQEPEQEPLPPAPAPPAPRQALRPAIHRSPSPDIMITDPPPPLRPQNPTQNPTPASSSTVASSSPFFPGPSKPSTAASTQLSRAMNLSPARPTTRPVVAVEIRDSGDEWDRMLDDGFDSDELATFEEADRRAAEAKEPEVINLSDDSDDDKENRPRRQMLVDDEDEIITISDSD